MSRDLYGCTATEFATHSIEHLKRGTSASDAAAWLTEYGYDAALVYADSDPVGFVHKNDITNSDEEENLRNSHPTNHRL